MRIMTIGAADLSFSCLVVESQRLPRFPVTGGANVVFAYLEQGSKLGVVRDMAGKAVRHRRRTVHIGSLDEIGVADEAELVQRTDQAAFR